jgi:hypothetical protein
MIEMGHKEVGCEDDMISLVEDRDQCWVVSNMFHKMVGNLFNSWVPTAFFRKNSAQWS